VFSELRHLERVQVVVQHQGGRCDFVLVAYAPSSGVLTGGGAGLNYALREEAGGRTILSMDPLGGSDTQVRGSFGGGTGTEIYEFYVEVPPQQFTPAGSYSDRVIFRIFDNEAGQFILKDEKGLAITAEVPGEVQASIGESLSGLREQNVELGRLTTGLTRTLGFTTRSNAPFAVSLSSANSGRLKHEFSSASVPYSVRFMGRTVNLDAGPVVALTESQVERVAQYDFDVQVGAVTARTPAGEYDDTLTVTITTL
jgi:spore coat protein U-like protein